MYLFNAVIISMFVIGFYALFTISPPLAFIWALSSIYLLYFFLRKHLCTHCVFYARPCFTGWGLLAARLFPKGSGNFKLGRSVAPLAWLWLFLAPLIPMIAERKLILLVWLALIVYVSSSFYRFHRRCPMRERCKR